MIEKNRGLDSSINPVSDNPKHSEEEEDDAHSSESAGVVRGLSRTVHTLTKKGPVGRLPSPVPKRIPGIPKIKIRKLPVRRRIAVRRAKVAKVSDAMSQGIDVVDLAQEASSSGRVESSARSSSSSGWMGWKSRIILFSGNLVKNTVLGTVVYETYDQAIAVLADDADCVSQDDEQHAPSSSDVYARTSTTGHFLAGAMAGTAHSLFSGLLVAAQSRTLPVLGLAWTAHHAVTHSVLFGGYEWSKRALLRQSGTADARKSESDKFDGEREGDKNKEKESHDKIDLPHFCAVFVAGGIAGSFQNVTSHYTEIMAMKKKPSSNGTKKRPVLKKMAPSIRMRNFLSTPFNNQKSWWSALVKARTELMYVTPLPSLRATLLAFPPTAVGFVAFEYGKDLLAADN